MLLSGMGYRFIVINPPPPPRLRRPHHRRRGLAGRPTNPNYQIACTQMYNHLAHIGESPAIQDHYTKLPPSRRGNFPAYKVGLSYGKGQKG
ncbi:hypothetical protein D9758_004454 [Tetrapyrgos nigripes]|uniref:Uncharacterized protein n=1 Tax=Tetrapyrgos nigripes TaxID=182062 RepID=A0A8H5LST1_9AGAR|nr:hypothetical protein D9758_004454 [Tetrapyrgos nigripes]